jgi:indolepyruvate decarboxylase
MYATWSIFTSTETEYAGSSRSHQHGKAVIDETFPHYLGIYTGKASEPHVRAAVETSDCLLSIGYRPIEVTTGDFTVSLPANTIHARGYSVDVGDDNYQAVTLKEILTTSVQ